MRKKRVYIFGLILIVLVLVVVKGIVFFSAGPKVTVNYLAEYNKLSRPEGFDPNDNADPLYKKAGAVYVPPSGLAAEARHKDYEDINDADKDALREWLTGNNQCIQYLKEGSQRKFFWAEENENNDAMLSAENLGPPDIMQLTRLLEQRASLAAMDGRFEDALTSLLECWKIADHYTDPKLLLQHQVFGMLVKQQTLKTAFVLLDCFTLDPNDLRLWQERWQSEFDGDDYVPGFQTERLFYYDRIQRNFVYHPKGKGRLAWKRASYFTALCGEGYNRRIYLSCLIGPSSNQVSQTVSSVCDYYESTLDKTPSQVRDLEAEYARNLEKIRIEQPILNDLIPKLRPMWWCYHRLKARSAALTAVIAALRYKEDYDNYPENLESLTPEYLSNLPQDPFGQGPLVYHLLDGDFELYSIEKDFEDNGGARYQGGNPISGIPKGDEVFWPPFRPGRKNMKFYPIGYSH